MHFKKNLKLNERKIGEESSKVTNKKHERERYNCENKF
jgi:hypothetical protein